MIDKAWEYIDEINYWDDEPKLWVGGSIRHRGPR